MKSPDTFLQIASGSLDNDSIVKNVFPSNLGITEKKILFWSTFNNELRISFDITRRYMVPNFVKQEGKKRETEDIRHYWPSHFSILNFFFFNQKWFIFTKNSHVFMNQDPILLQKLKFMVNFSHPSKTMVDENWNTHLPIQN